MIETVHASATSAHASRSRGILPSFAAAATFALAVAPLQALAAESLAVLPAEIALTGPASHQRVVVERVRDGKLVGELSEGVKLETDNAKVFTVEGGVVHPVGNGTAKLTAKVGNESASVTVTVKDMDKPFVWSFRNHVQSVLVKAGCNSGACHGAAAGKKGLKLSLRGYDAFGDYATLTRQARGRRVSLADPARSLILLKPTTTIPHQGGLRFETNSPEYKVIAEWVASGAPPPKVDDAQITGLDIIPKATVLSPKSKQQLLVQAKFSDGRVEDVTRWVKYTSTNAEVLTVDDLGKAEVVGQGEGAVTAWHLNMTAVATVSAPYQQEIKPEVFAHAAKRNFIDEIVLDKLKQLNVPPSPLGADAEFIRRLSIDMIGVLPTAAETKAFVADKAPDKRDRLIEQLMSRPEFIDYWSYRWSDLLLVNSEKLGPEATWSFYNWIRNQVAANTPWDEMVRRLLTAQGSTLENGATNFYVLHQDPRDATETISTAFMGLSIGCARCHNHPLEKWTNDQYFGMANLLSRVRLKNQPQAGNLTVFAATDGELIQPLTGAAQPPRPLDAAPIPFESREDRRITLAQWLTDPSNPYFSRSIANRVWANFLGVGIVEKVDDLRLTNPASNPILLDALAKRLVDDKFDLRSLMRAIAQSTTYQRSSTPVQGNEGDKRFYSRYYPRRMMAEVLIDAISQVSGVAPGFPGYPASWRATQLPDANVESYFLQKFGRPDRVITCDCERTNEPNMVQVLHIANGDAINKRLANATGRIEKLLAEKATDAAIVDELYMSALSRPATAAERDGIIAILAEAGEKDRRAALEDVYWSVLSSKEFLFNH